MRRYLIVLLALSLTGGGLLAGDSLSPLLSATSGISNQEALGSGGENFKGFRFGAHLRDFYNINKVRPISNSHIAGDEESCEFFSPAQDLQIGDFRIKQADVYLIFWRERLIRIRIINTFSGRDESDLKYFNALRTALTQKYGSASSQEDIFSPYDGIYQWKTENLRVGLSYTTLEYGWLELEKKLVESFKRQTRITSSDI